MSVTSIRHGRRGTLAAAAVTVALTVASAIALTRGLHPTGGPPQPAVAATVHASDTPDTPRAQGAPERVPGNARAATALTSKTLVRSRPVHLTIAAIGLDTGTIVALGRQPDGSLQVPARFDVPGWFTPGPAPGQLGPAVLAGHVDSKAGPGIFYRLGAWCGAELRLITCGGSFDRNSGHYLNNTVAYAHLL
jgi:hypothetical protein